jgi:uncharacterized protein with GYD domain
MGDYVILSSWTNQGVHDYKDTLERADLAAEIFQDAGGELKDVIWTMGPYDVIVLASFPDEQSAAKAALKLGGEGRVRTTTMRAFRREEIASIIG